MNSNAILAIIIAYICVGCTSPHLTSSDIPITRLVIYPGNSYLRASVTIEGDGLNTVLNGHKRYDTAHVGWMEHPISIIQGNVCRKGKLVWLPAYLPIAEIVIPYKRFLKTYYEVLMLSDTGSQALVELMRAVDTLPNSTLSTPDE